MHVCVPRRGALGLGLLALLPVLTLAFSPLGTAPSGLLLRANARTCSVTGRPLAARSMRSPVAPRMCAPVNAATLLEENPKALMATARDGNLELVKELIALSANVEAIDWKGRTGLHYAAEKGFQDIAKALVGAGAKLDTKTSDGLSPLHCASWMGEDTAIALDLIAAGADLEARDNEGWTPLHTAASNDRSAMTQALIEAGADINAVSVEGWTALHFASDNGSPEVVKVLIAGGANLEIRNSEEETALSVPVLKGKRQVWPGHHASLKMLCDAGADLTVKDAQGGTPLHRASYMGHPELVQVLMDGGANLEMKNNGGDTPLCLAVFRGHDDVTKMLIDRGADVTVEGEAGETPLVQAKTDSLKELLKAAGATK